jgi:hypothetical protein
MACITTLIVTTHTGERQRVDPQQIVVKVVQNDSLVLPHTVEDKKDGTYEIVFTPTELGKLILNIETFGTKSFEFPIKIGGQADPAKCEAKCATPSPKVNEPVLIVVVAKDKAGQRFTVGGTVFSISFAGEGELYNVDLQDQMDGSYFIKVTPNKPGNYVVYISLGEVDIAASPIGFCATY